MQEAVGGPKWWWQCVCVWEQERDVKTELLHQKHLFQLRSPADTSWSWLYPWREAVASIQDGAQLLMKQFCWSIVADGTWRTCCLYKDKWRWCPASTGFSKDCTWSRSPTGKRKSKSGFVSVLPTYVLESSAVCHGNTMMCKLIWEINIQLAANAHFKCLHQNLNLQKLKS